MNVTKETHTVSVIVPVYNAAKYLDKCLHSIVTQSYPYLEIVCVNDGSTDESADIIEKYRKKDDRIVVVNQENKGLSAARNAGTDKASGNYITYVDADDFIEVNMIEVMLKNMLTHDSDIVIESVWMYDDKTKNRVANEDTYFSMSWLSPAFNGRAFSYAELIDRLFMLPVMAWAKLYKADFLKNSGVRFPEGLIYEDNPFFFELLFKTNKISVDRRQLYNYRVNVDKSITKDSGKNYADMLIIMEMLEKLFKAQPFYEQIKFSFLCFRLKHTIKTLFTVNKKYEKKYFYKMQNEFLNIDLLYYNEALLAKQPFYDMYCDIRNSSFTGYRLKRLLNKYIKKFAL